MTDTALPSFLTPVFTFEQQKVKTHMASQLSDEDIIRAVRTRADGVEWLTQYITRHWKTASTKVLRSKGANDDEAFSVFGKAITAFYYNLAKDDFRGDSDLETYFIAICKGQLARLIRENIRERNKDPETVAADHRNPHFEMEQNQLAQVLEKCLNELAEPCRSIERLKWLEGCCLEAIAERLDMTLRQVKGKSTECLNKFKERLKKYGYGR